MPVRTDPTVRSLRDIVRDFELRGKPVTKALAEEAVRAVAADGVITKDEVDVLRPYGDGPVNLSGSRPTDRDTWKKGSEAGRALFNSLSDTIEERYRVANPNARPSEPVNPFTWWLGGWAGSRDNAPAVNASELMKQVRQSSMGWVDNSIHRLLEDYPKATRMTNTYQREPKADVKAAIASLKRDWLAGKVQDEKNLGDALKPLLTSKYR